MSKVLMFTCDKHRFWAPELLAVALNATDGSALVVNIAESLQKAKEILGYTVPLTSMGKFHRDMYSSKLGADNYIVEWVDEPEKHELCMKWIAAVV